MSCTDPPSQALVVGASQYQHVRNLRPTLDVAGVRDVLASPDYCAYPPEQVTVLAEADATRDNILRALTAMCERARAAGSRTFFYFSGHGGQGPDGASYILPVDACKAEYPATAISSRDLSRIVARCAGELTLVLDCCRAAGMASPAEPSTDLVAFTDSFRNDMQFKGRVVFAASGDDGRAFASPESAYGIFTGHMLDGLRGAASTNGGDVTVQQLFDYIQQRVVLSSRSAQRPVFIANTEAFYPLTRYPRPIAPSVVFEKDVYISYDRGDPILRDWVTQVFQTELEKAGRSIWDHDDLGYNKLEVEEAIVKCRYVVVLLTRSYLENRFEEFTTTLAVLQAIDTRTPRFIPVLRELFNLPYWIKAFGGLDMTPRHEMEFPYNMARLIKRLAKEPHER